MFITCRGVPITESVTDLADFPLLAYVAPVLSFDCGGFYYMKLLEMTTGL